MRNWIEVAEAVTPRLTKTLVRSVLRWTENHWAYPLGQGQIEQLLALPVRPDVPVRLYRGLLFGDSNRAARFENAVKSGNLSIQVSAERITSWTSEPYVADGFARNANVGDDNHLGQIMTRQRWKDSQIDGVFGVVVSMEASPDMIICGLDYLGMDNEFAHEHEFLLKPGPYQVTITKAYDQNGEISL